MIRQLKEKVKRNETYYKKRKLKEFVGLIPKKHLDECGVTADYNSTTGKLKLYNSNGIRLKEGTLTALHPYGKDRTYKFFSINNHGKQINALSHIIVWVLHHDYVSHDMNVTFKDNNTKNYRIENLTLLTPAESISKKRFR